MIVYAVVYQDYDYVEIDGIFSSKEKALKYIANAGAGGGRFYTEHDIVAVELDKDRWCKHLRSHTDYEVGSGSTAPINTYCTDCGVKL